MINVFKKMDIFQNPYFWMSTNLHKKKLEEKYSYYVFSPFVSWPLKYDLMDRRKVCPKS